MKDGYPSVAHNVICDHKGFVLSFLPGAYGSTDDMIIVRFDGEVDAVRCDPFYKEIEFQVRTGPGPNDRAMVKGAYLITGCGGYSSCRPPQNARGLRGVARADGVRQEGHRVLVQPSQSSLLHPQDAHFFSPQGQQSTTCSSRASAIRT